MKKHIGSLLRVLLGASFLGGAVGGAADAQQGSTFASREEAQAYLATNPRGPRAEEAFRYLLITDLRSVDPNFESLSPTRSLDGVVESETVLNNEAQGLAQQQIGTGSTQTGTTGSGVTQAQNTKEDVGDRTSAY